MDFFFSPCNDRCWVWILTHSAAIEMNPSTILLNGVNYLVYLLKACRDVPIVCTVCPVSTWWTSWCLHLFILLLLSHNKLISIFDLLRQNHPSESILAQCRIFLSKLSAIYIVIDSFCSKAMCEFLPNYMHAFHCNHIFSSKYFVPLMECVRWGPIDERRLFFHFRLSFPSFQDVFFVSPRTGTWRTT